jgi:hypothetical protein
MTGTVIVVVICVIWIVMALVVDEMLMGKGRK